MLQQVRVLPKTLAQPLFVWGDTQGVYLQRIRGLARAMTRKVNGAPAPGRLVITQPDGEQRYVDCYYIDGLEGDEPRGAGTTWYRCVPRWVALQPYWQSLDTRTESFTPSAAVSFYPLLPVHLAPSQTVDAAFVDNVGDVEAYPVWTIEGPATSVTVAHADIPGSSFTLTRTLAAADTVVIDTEPTLATAVLNGTTDVWANLTGDPSLWPLQPGANDLTLTVAGSTADSKVAATYRPRYDWA